MLDLSKRAVQTIITCGELPAERDAKNRDVILRADAENLRDERARQVGPARPTDTNAAAPDALVEHLMGDRAPQTRVRAQGHDHPDVVAIERGADPHDTGAGSAARNAPRRARSRSDALRGCR